MKIVYVISSLDKTGPVNVLYNIIKSIDSSLHDIVVVTLKTSKKIDVERFRLLKITYRTLGLSFLETIVKGKRKLERIIMEENPDIVHAQCFRSVLLISSISGRWKTCATIHCYPHLDFVYEYGYILGKIMTSLYVRALRKIDEPIACSSSISKALYQRFSLVTKVILNGVEHNRAKNVDLSKYLRNKQQLIFLCVSCFNLRKNQKQLLKSAQELLETDKIAILFLGDGKYRSACESLKIKNTYFLGNIDNVNDYYNVADGIISASKAEGCPMAVLEALMMGVPRYVLSDIPPHDEIKSMFPDLVKVFNFNNKLTEYEINDYSSISERKNIISLADKYVSARKMSEKYVNIYRLMQAGNEDGKR